MVIVVFGNWLCWWIIEFYFFIVKGLLKDILKRVCVLREKISYGDVVFCFGDKFFGDIYFVFEFELINVFCSWGGFVCESKFVL